MSQSDSHSASLSLPDIERTPINGWLCHRCPHASIVMNALNLLLQGKEHHDLDSYTSNAANSFVRDAIWVGKIGINEDTHLIGESAPKSSDFVSSSPEEDKDEDAGSDHESGDASTAGVNSDDGNSVETLALAGDDSVDEAGDFEDFWTHIPHLQGTKRKDYFVVQEVLDFEEQNADRGKIARAPRGSKPLYQTARNNMASKDTFPVSKCNECVKRGLVDCHMDSWGKICAHCDSLGMSCKFGDQPSWILWKAHRIANPGAKEAWVSPVFSTPAPTRRNRTKEGSRLLAGSKRKRSE